MEIKRGFKLTDTYKCLIGVTPYTQPPIRSLPQGSIDNFLKILKYADVVIDEHKSYVCFLLGENDCSTSLKEYLKLENRGCLEKYVLKGVASKIPVEIKLKGYDESYGAAPGGIIPDGGEVVFEQGISGHIKLNVSDADTMAQYYNDILRKIVEWGETCRLSEVQPQPRIHR